MKRKIKITSWILLLAMLIGIVSHFCDTETYQAATSYTNAKEFYESTYTDKGAYHVDTAYGKVYYATQAKLASSSTNTRYYTVGFDVTLSGNGHSVSFTVQRQGGSMTQVGNPVRSGNYEYNLYVITEDKLFELATKANSTSAAYVLSTSTINVRMDAIMTTISAGSTTPNGGITENGYGGFTKRGTIYRLKNSADLKAIKEIFSGHTFESYKEIYADLENYLLKVRYNVLGLNPIGNTPTLSNSSYKFDTAGLLQKSGSTYYDESRTLKKITLLNTGSIGLSKTGYHLQSGKEWVTDNSRYFASNSTHQSTVVDPTVGYQNHGITLYANWKPNTCKVNYNANGGKGSISPSTLVYDTESNLRANTFTRTGYTLVQGKEWIDANGNTYESGQAVKNLTTANNAEITLYANWVPCVYQITTDKQNGTGGTDVFFEKYDTGFYSNEGCTNNIDVISIPTRVGYTLLGYYARMNGGQLIVDASGQISVPNTTFIKDSVIYANWKANQYMITFDKQGGEYGTDTAVATYDKVFPIADAPVWEGYSFKGYFTEPGGKGTKVYNEFMASDMIYTYARNITVYAYWEDDVAPLLTFTADHDTWTNQKVTVTAESYDYGSGLSSLTIYQIGAGNSLTPVATATNLNGLKAKTLSFVNTQEGIVRYKAIATDMEGNAVESYTVVYYDITAPSGTIVDSKVEDGKFYFEIDITDIDTGN